MKCKQKVLVRKPPLGARLNRSHPLTLGLVGRWVMNEGGGNTVYDCAGIHNGTLASGQAWGSGPFGTTVVFDGVDDVITINDPNIVEGVNQLSVSCWIQSSLLAQAGPRTIIAWAGAADRPFALELGSTELIQFWVTNTLSVDVIADSNSALTDNAPHHVVGVYNGANVLLYIDGVLQTDQPAQTGLTPSITAAFNVARSTADWAGIIDDVRVYDRTLSHQEIHWLYQEPFADFQPVRRVFGNVAQVAFDELISSRLLLSVP